MFEQKKNLQRRKILTAGVQLGLASIVTSGSDLSFVKRSLPLTVTQTPGESSPPPDVTQIPGESSPPPDVTQTPGESSPPPDVTQTPGESSPPPDVTQTPGEETTWQEVADVFGKKGSIKPGNVLQIDLPRLDINPTLLGVPIKPDLALTSTISFQARGDDALVKYELVLLEQEVNPVIDALLSQNVKPTTTIVNALHNHFAELTPSVIFLHGTLLGDPMKIARALRKAVLRTSTPLKTSKPGTQDPGFETLQVEQIVGTKGTSMSGIFSLTINRTEQFRELGVSLQAAMQVASMIHFQAVSGDQVATAGEIVVLPEEADTVISVLRSSGLTVTALHNHELLIEPQPYYVHYFGTGSAVKLALATRDALRATRSVLANTVSSEVGKE